MEGTEQQCDDEPDHTYCTDDFPPDFTLLCIWYIVVECQLIVHFYYHYFNFAEYI